METAAPFGDDSRHFERLANAHKAYFAALDAGHWRRIAPWLAITDQPFARPATPLVLDAESQAQCTDQLVREGYFQTPPLFARDEVEPLANAVRAVVAAGFHPIFASVYDEFWRLLARLVPVVEPLVGPGVQVVPDYWIWAIEGSGASSGWAPHRDNQFRGTIRPDGRPAVMTVWLPLTDATPINSCIYVLPLDRDPNHPSDLDQHDVGRLQDVRALPAPAGSILGWNQHLLHWGSRAARHAGEARISCGIL